jgi:hypothetical protein
MSDTVRIGTGAGFSADRLDPAVELVARAELDYLVFECLGERTLAFGQRDRMRDPAAGYNKLLAPRFRAILPLARAHGTRIVTNMGAANPRAAAERTLEVARALGLRGLRVACVEGDDVTALIDAPRSCPSWGDRWARWACPSWAPMPTSAPMPCCPPCRPGRTW